MWTTIISFTRVTWLLLGACLLACLLGGVSEVTDLLLLLIVCWVGWVRWLTCCCCWLFAGCSSLLVFLVWLLENFSWNKFWRCKIPEVLENFQQDIFLFIFDGGRITHTYFCVKDKQHEKQTWPSNHIHCCCCRGHL